MADAQLCADLNDPTMSMSPTRADPFVDTSTTVSTALDTEDFEVPIQDFNTFLESVGLLSSWDDDMFVSGEQDSVATPLNSLRYDSPSRSSMLQSASAAPNDGQHLRVDEPSLSNFGSRLPSLQPETNHSHDRTQSTDPSQHSLSFPEITKQDYRSFLQKLETFSDTLSQEFVPPSRYCLSRFFAGYVDGLNEHLPFVHVPTFSVAHCSPELTLALAAAGSHYRFEGRKSLPLFRSAKAILLGRFVSTNNSSPQSPLSLLLSHKSSEPLNEMEWADQPQPFGRSSGFRMDDADACMELIQTFLLLTIMSTWETDLAALQEILALQSTLAALIRNHGLAESESELCNSNADTNLKWKNWVKKERDRRTKLVAYCFMNLHSAMYNTSPLILNSELKLHMPCPSDLWKASDACQWQSLYQHSDGLQANVQQAFKALFVESESSNAPALMTPLGNHILIHAIVQQIFFARQLSSSTGQNVNLRREDLSMLEDALRRWKAGWKRTSESSVDPRSPAGPIAFTSTAFLGLAYIRLHLDLGPHRALMSLNPRQIAKALYDAPQPLRSSNLIMPLLHAVHALSIPVLLGIDFVAKTQSLYWSVQHSLSSIEYAYLLSRWLLALSASPDQKLSKHEQRLLRWIKSIVNETDMFIKPATGSEVDLALNTVNMRQLAVTVVRVWAQTFKGSTSWGIVDLMGLSLDVYADLLEDRLPEGFPQC